jgi:hypothetical protein
MKTLCDDLSCLLIDCKNVTFAFVQSKMVDYILGVSDPIKWHSANLKMNSDHYASWMVHLGGARLITNVADKVGVGVHFNPFVNWNDRVRNFPKL